MNLKVIGYKTKQFLVSKRLVENLEVAKPCMNRLKLTVNKYNFVIKISLNLISTEKILVFIFSTSLDNPTI